MEKNIFPKTENDFSFYKMQTLHYFLVLLFEIVFFPLKFESHMKKFFSFIFQTSAPPPPSPEIFFISYF